MLRATHPHKKNYMSAGKQGLEDNSNILQIRVSSTLTLTLAGVGCFAYNTFHVW